MSLPSLPQGFTLHPFTLPDDIPTSVDLNRLAYTSNALPQFLIPTSLDTPARRKWSIQQLKRRWADPIDGPRMRYVKIMKFVGAEDEEVVAVAGWWAPRVGKKHVKSEEEKARESYEAVKNFPPGTKIEERQEKMVERIEGMRKVLLGEDWEERYWYIGMLATRPGYERLGLGSALVQWGVQQARAQVKENPEGPAEGLCLESTPVALRVYLRNEFREVASITHDLGEGKEYKHVFLVQKLK